MISVALLNRAFTPSKGWCVLEKKHHAPYDSVVLMRASGTDRPPLSDQSPETPVERGQENELFSFTMEGSRKSSCS